MGFWFVLVCFCWNSLCDVNDKIPQNVPKMSLFRLNGRRTVKVLKKADRQNQKSKIEKSEVKKEMNKQHKQPSEEGRRLQK